jgi:hypothetical protein
MNDEISNLFFYEAEIVIVESQTFQTASGLVNIPLLQSPHNAMHLLIAIKADIEKSHGVSKFALTKVVRI